jgi:hypothetical protein
MANQDLSCYEWDHTCYERDHPLDGAREMATRDAFGDLFGLLINRDGTDNTMSITIDHGGNTQDILLNSEQAKYVRDFINKNMEGL